MVKVRAGGTEERADPAVLPWAGAGLGKAFWKRRLNLTPYQGLRALPCAQLPTPLFLTSSLELFRDMPSLAG